jgi:hypothetical protein
MITREYRKTDEYKALYEAVQRACPGIPDIIAEQAIFLHKRDPMLYKRIVKEEREEKRRQAEEDRRRKAASSSAAARPPEAAHNKKEGDIIESNDVDGARVSAVLDEHVGDTQ